METEVEDGLHAFPASRGVCPVHPQAEYADWRADEGGLTKIRLLNGTWAWFVLSAEHVQTLLRDKRLSADRLHPNYPQESPIHASGPTAKSFRSMDGEQHMVFRRMLAKEFSAQRIDELRPLIQETTAELIAAIKAKGAPADLFTDLALALPMRIVCAHIGVPFEHRDRFDVWINALLAREGDPADAMKAGQEMVQYIYELIDQRGAEPCDDLVSRVATGPLARGEITRDQAMSTVLILFLGGYESTAFSLGTGLLALLQNPDQLARVRAGLDTQGVNRMVEELLRYTSVTDAGMDRFAVEDIEIGGKVIAAGDGVIFHLPTANRDPELFTNPDVLDIGRDGPRHLAFGWGAHQCVGQNLARADLQEAIPTVVAALPGLRLAVPDEEVPFRENVLVVGATSLPVTWDE